ncbi:MAG: hypothetical protein KGL15_09790, partial [Acidobacteriota bacterium]|nr:hypothetical protein [Acidobacteriota bacterium]
MSSITTDLRAPAVARPRALRVADGVIAGYIHSLARAAADPAAGAGRPKLSRLAARAYERGAGRGSGVGACSRGVAGRRRPQLLRVAATA